MAMYQAVAMERRSREEGDPPHQALPGKARILIVDDEEEIRSLLDRLLKMNGYACVTAS